MIPGVSVAMGGQDWIVPPLTLGQLRRLMPKVRQLTEIGAAMGEAQINVLIDIVTAALQRNYPETTPDKVENLLDLGNASAVLNAVLTGSGLKPGGADYGGSICPRDQPGGRQCERQVGFGDDFGDGDPWREIYGLLATVCGYSYPIIDEMTLFQIEELTSYWAQHPPLHLLVAAYLGVGKNRHPQQSPTSMGRGQRPSSEANSLLGSAGAWVWCRRRQCRALARSPRFC